MKKTIVLLLLSVALFSCKVYQKPITVKITYVRRDSDNDGGEVWAKHGRVWYCAFFHVPVPDSLVIGKSLVLNPINVPNDSSKIIFKRSK